MDKKSLIDSTKKEVLKDQLVYNLNVYPLTIQERDAIKKVIKELELNIKRMTTRKDDLK